ncbi:CAP domain-containing protein [Metabacillus arenae]|uniref:Sporulation protein n=1 Tax=Metabacillus arenae TaxID=2771434 RepID=A0A926NME8_9BACI|nr:CAP domain-containing protein [Metabacillus arenae]MBD1383308.1 sporulation protein [Metabacillus arenae]
MKKSIMVSVAAAATLFTFNGGQSADAAELNKADIQSKVVQLGVDCNLNNINQEQVQQILNKNIDQKQIQEIMNKYFQGQQAQAQQPQQKEQAPKQEQAQKPQQQAQAQPKEQAQAQPKEQAQAQPKEQAQPAPQQQPKQEAQAGEQPKTEQTNKSVSEFEQKVVDLTNAERQKQGLKPLQLDTKLSDVAREKSNDMKAKNYFDHNSPTYGSPFDMMKQFGIDYRTAGENIAMGQQSPEEVVNAWMNSEGHRKNIMNSEFTHIGVGHVAEGNYWTQMFIGK